MRDPAPTNPDTRVGYRADRAITPADEQAFRRARDRLSAALSGDSGIMGEDDVAKARIELRALAVKLRDAGYWRSDKAGLRSTVALLWQADRFVSEQALATQTK